jgi:hypothetical protein
MQTALAAGKTTHLVVDLHHGEAQQEIALWALLYGPEYVPNGPLDNAQVIMTSLRKCGKGSLSCRCLACSLPPNNSKFPHSERFCESRGETCRPLPLLCPKFCQPPTHTSPHQLPHPAMAMNPSPRGVKIQGATHASLPVISPRLDVITIMVCVLPEEVTPYANTVALMPSMAAATTLLADLVYTCSDAPTP